jgi:N-acetylneuraminic acid mutarotase
MSDNMSFRVVALHVALSSALSVSSLALPSVVRAANAPTGADGTSGDAGSRAPRSANARGAASLLEHELSEIEGATKVDDPSWTTTGSLALARHSHTATLLPNGKVLVVGGTPPDISAELYDPETGTWSPTGSLTDGPRVEHTATLLQNGKVLVVGGYESGYTTAEVYDPETGTWSPTGSPAKGRQEHTATLLPNGEVLVVGGSKGKGSGALRSAEIYDPETGRWRRTGSLANARAFGHTATLLADGTVLVVGGSNRKGPLAIAEVYDPGTGRWRRTGSLANATLYHTATRLSDGTVLVAGPSASAEVYDPATGTWNSVGNLATVHLSHTATLLRNGTVLVVGGINAESILASAEVYDPATGTWNSAGNLTTARYSHTATLLSDGRVLVVGGSGNENVDLASAEVYDPELDRTHAPPLVALDDLRAEQSTPDPKRRLPASACRDLISQGLARGPHIRAQPVRTHQNAADERRATHPTHQAPDERQITIDREFAAEPQARTDHHGHRHPTDRALDSHPQLVGLHLPELSRLLDEVLVKALAVRASAREPRGDRAFVEAEGGDDGLKRAAVGQQGQDDRGRLGWRTQAIEDGPGPLGERRSALSADQAALVSRMHADVAFARLPPGRAVGVGAECGGRVHEGAPLDRIGSSVGEDASWSHSFLPFSPLHG